MTAQEVNFDGLVGPTHNYAGLSDGNLAATRNKGEVSRPRQAALEGIAKMRALMALGLPQGVLPPQERPNIPWLRRLGFHGSDAAVWEAAYRQEPVIARNAMSASSMWAANAATVSPSADCADGRVHFTPANLLTMLHRAQEWPTTQAALRAIFADEKRFAVHDALPLHAAFADEGAANHMRLCASPGAPGVEVFVYGRTAEQQGATAFPGRQTLEACRAIARAHDLKPERTSFLRQAPKAIDAGAFHNDVVAVAHETTLFFHECAFADRDAALQDITHRAEGLFSPHFVEVKEADLSLSEAVSSYLFNSQIVHAPGRARLTLIAPAESRESNRAAAAIQQAIESGGPIGEAIFVNVRESMRNGGGPACLRLRVVLTPEERAAAAQGFFLDDDLAARLEAWVTAHYREELAPADLGDPALMEEARTALDALTRILPLGPRFYEFQRAGA